MMRGSLELLPFVDDDESDECSDEGLESSEATDSFKSDTMHRVFFLPRALHLKGKIVTSEKDNCSLESCHDREARKMEGQRMVRKNKSPDGKQPSGGVGGQSSHNTWDISQP